MNTLSASGFAQIIYGVVAGITLLRAGIIVRQMRYVWRHRLHVPAAFVEQISAAQHLRAAEYTVAKNRLALFHLALEWMVFLGATWLGGLTVLSSWWARHLTAVLAQDVALIASVLFIITLLELPLDLYRKFILEQRFGFNTTSIAAFFKDMLLQTALGAALGLPLLGAVLWVMLKMGSLWWWYAWLLWVTFNLFLLMIYPVWIAPLFNRFTPLSEGELKQSLQKLLKQCDFAAEGLYVMDGSRRSRHGNAFFTGFGRNRRIVLFDTLIQHLQTVEIGAVLAHELGHFYHKHVLGRMISIFALSLTLLWGLAQAMHQPVLFAGLHVNMSSAGMALSLLIVALPVLALPVQVLMSLASRQQEFEADAYAAGAVEAEHLISALVHLYRDNATSLTSDPWYSLFFDSHPNAQQRVAHLLALAHEQPVIE